MPATKPAREVEFEVLGKDGTAGPRAGAGPGAGPETDPLIAFIAKLMDSIFVVPGTKIRFGLDPIIGLIPALGPTASSLVSIFLIAMSARRGVPKVILTRMAVNVLINAGLDAVPGVGDVLSVFFRSNARNYELLQKHSGPERPPTTGDKVFLVALLLGVLLVVALFLIGSWTVLRFLFAPVTQ